MLKPVRFCVRHAKGGQIVLVVDGRSSHQGKLVRVQEDSRLGEDMPFMDAHGAVCAIDILSSKDVWLRGGLIVERFNAENDVAGDADGRAGAGPGRRRQGSSQSTGPGDQEV